MALSFLLFLTHTSTSYKLAVAGGTYEQIDKETLKRLKDIQLLSSENKNHVFALLDAFLKQVKLQNIMQ